MSEDESETIKNQDELNPSDQLSLDAVGANNAEDLITSEPISEPVNQEADEQPLEPSKVKQPEKPKNTKEKNLKLKTQNKWIRILGFSVGSLALIAIIISGVFSQYYKGKTMPGVIVAGKSSSAKTSSQLNAQIQDKTKNLKITLLADTKKIEPKFEEIGFKVDVNKTVDAALKAKRDKGLLTKITFWKTVEVPAVITINDTLLNQYVETHVPELSKAAQDAQMQFDVASSKFIITDQADGQGPNVDKLKTEISDLGKNLDSKAIKLKTAVEKPKITKAKLEPLIEPANDLVSRKITLTGLGFYYQATPAEIASWVTPTPKEGDVVKLVIDPGKIQSYVDGISKKISSAPLDQKVIKDDQTGAEVVLQAGRNGTELADRQVLANAIAEALKSRQDTAQTMNIKTAEFKTVNLSAYDKWIEVDLSEQRTTAYEKATPIKNFLIASGMRGHETVTGEFSIWLKVRSQTMQGGSKADGSYYNLPNVEWVSYFYQDYALHGAYWRKVFGVPGSHGCVNMTNDDAQWLYNWAPLGTKVIVHQ